ncbi:MAG: hypothetical protein AAFQ66_14640 [Pseudomonadota bacterium]
MTNLDRPTTHRSKRVSPKWTIVVVSWTVCSLIGAIFGSLVGLVIAGEAGGMAIFALLFMIIALFLYPESEAAVQFLNKTTKVKR